jgi:hypothetical protein
MSTKRKRPHNQRPKGGRVTPSKKGVKPTKGWVGANGQKHGWFKVSDLEDAGVLK